MPDAPPDPTPLEPTGPEAVMEDEKKRVRFDCLVNHPGWGSLWLDHVRLVNGSVVGTTHFPHPANPFYDDPMTMNFPLSCVRKWERR